PLPGNSASRWLPERRRNRNVRESTIASAAARCAVLCCPKWGISPSTCPQPTFSFRFPARSAPARKKHSDSDEFCVRNTTAAPPVSSRSSLGTRAKRNSRITASYSSSSRDTLIRLLVNVEAIYFLDLAFEFDERLDPFNPAEIYHRTQWWYAIRFC